VLVVVLVLDTERLRSFEDEHEDETATKFMGNCVDLAQFLFRSDWPFVWPAVRLTPET